MQKVSSLTTSLLLGTLLTCSLIFLPVQKTSALSGSDFRAGHIIDDPVFFDPGGLSVHDIQNFLNAKVPTCDTNGTQPYAGTTRGAYGASKGYPPPYTCLKDYRQTTISKPADAFCSGYAQVNQSAAEIIYGVAQSCGVNPTVLVVLLQKEQGLVTDSWPWSSQYNKATGYGCPDTAACDTQYSGFFNQVYSAARQFKNYVANSVNFNYRANRNNNIQYNPSSSCGGSSVYIHTPATAALYNYTPYQPNGAALNNLYGTGDSCSAYGNRNFWRDYNDWFGSTSTTPYRWSPVSQQTYTDSSKTVVLRPHNVVPGQRFFASVTVKNVGTRTWEKGSVMLGTSQPQNRASIFKDWTWPSTKNNRAGTFNESTVAPGQTATFDFWMQTPWQSGDFTEFFNLVANDTTYLNDMGLNFKLNVNSTHYNWEELSKGIYTDSSKQVKANFEDLQPNRRYLVSLRVKNIGNVTWQKNSVQLGTWLPADRASIFKDWTWPSTKNNRAGTFNEESVAPEQTATFDFWILTPANVSGVRYNESFNLIDGNRWMVEIGQQFPFTIHKPHYGYTPISQQLYTDSSKTTTLNPSTITAGQRFFASVKIKNVGMRTWEKGPVMLGTSQPRDRASIFKDWTWPSTNNNRTGTINESTVAPGQTATFDFWVQAPNTPGQYTEFFNVVVENVAWMNDMNISFSMKVN